MERAIDLRTNLQRFGALVGVAIFIAIVSSFLQPSHYDVREVDTALAKEMIAAGALVVDVRTREAFVRQHIAGAISVPLEELRSAIPASVASDKARRIVIYCGDGSTTGPEGTYVMNQAGFKEAVNLKGGLESWQRAGMAVASGAA